MKAQVNKRTYVSDEVLVELRSEYTRVMTIVEDINAAFLNKTNIYFAGFFVAFSVSFVNNELGQYLSIVLPFILLYYGYNSLKYTLKIFEYRGYAIAIEERINEILSCNVLHENILCSEYKGKGNKFASQDSKAQKGSGIFARGIYGGLIQIAFILPISIFALISFIKSIGVIESKFLSTIIILLLVLAASADAFLAYLCISMTTFSKNRVKTFWNQTTNMK